MHFLKKALIVLGIALIGLVGYQFQKKEKLDNYFIEQFTMDYLIQSSRNEKNCHGEIFEKAVKDMERKGYSQDQIYKSMVKGFDKANTILQQQSQDQYLS